MCCCMDCSLVVFLIKVFSVPRPHVHDETQIGDENRIMAKHGSLGELDHAKGDWKSYVERAEQCFLANDITDEDRQRATLLSCCGDAT